MDDFDEWAGYYDAIYQSDPNGDDYDHYEALMRDCSAPALEVGCGTGRLYLDALAAGHDCHGLDVSEEMLRRLRERAEERGVDPTVMRGDVRSFDAGESYGLIYWPFNSVTHLRGVDEQVAAFENVRKHLQTGGVFAFDVYVPDFDKVAAYGELSRETVEHDGREYVVEMWEEMADQTHQYHDVHERVIDVETGRIEFETTFELSLLPKEQAELLLRAAGFDEWEFYGGFDRRPIEADAERMVVVARDG